MVIYGTLTTIVRCGHSTWTSTAGQIVVYMAMLLQEAFRHAPNATFTLEVTTPRSREVYKHYAFEVVREGVVGKGKVDALGVNASGDAATGFPIYPMIKVP
ncbi:hypothetical protein C8R45DRAFT_942034 [Mycena sanguinolenta]|nr:hypothetical protein C8R45DRAFT_942034 [Mycena sanguinolenta]